MIKESIAKYERAVVLSDYEASLPVAALACSYYRIGEKDKADRLFECLKKRSENEYVPATSLYLIHRVRGEEALALDFLKKACDEHDSFLVWFRAHPFLIPEGSNYMALLKEMLGHSNSIVTEHYLSSIDPERTFEINSVLL
jgi:tetratricopeptide (TPR) repeat protein